jgi:MoaA/NifB/PqqE/SkfB family radical SAM enzyme
VCPDLSVVKHVSDPDHYCIPKGFAIENTSLCPLKCISCPRDKLAQIRKGRRSMSLVDIENLSQMLHDIDAVECNFVNLGEPFLSKNVRQELEIIRRSNPDIKINTSTSCVPMDSDEKREAALLTDHIVVSIFGISTEMCNRYQRGLDFEKAYANMKSLIEFRNSRGSKKPHILWHYVIFCWNDHPKHIQRAIELSEEAGVDEMVFTFSRTPAYGISWRFLLSLSPFNDVIRNKGEWRYRRILRSSDS